MTREETLELLAFLKGCYPNAKIDAPDMMAAAWEMCFGEYEAGLVYQAALLHIKRNKFFPTPADIFENITRARILYTAPQQALTGETAKAIPSETGSVGAIINDLGLYN